MKIEKIKLLWIEDEVFERLAEKHVYIQGTFEFDIELAVTAQEAQEKIGKGKFDIVLIDIRIPPGQHFDIKKDENRLGIEIIKIINKYKCDPKFDIGKASIGLFTNERWDDITDIVEPLGITSKNFRQKRSVDTGKKFYDFLKSLIQS